MTKLTTAFEQFINPIVHIGCIATDWGCVKAWLQGLLLGGRRHMPHWLNVGHVCLDCCNFKLHYL
jgi:hypothetical protein